MVQKNREPNFDPWQSSMFNLVKHSQDPTPSKSLPQRSFSRVDCTDVQIQPRRYTTISTQSPRLPDIEKKTEHLGEKYLGSRPASVSQSYNNFYQRLRGGYAGSQTARGPEDRMPQIHHGMQSEDSGSAPPLLRAGKGGASWRHVTQVTGNLGNHLCFIDGRVKETDITKFPPYGYGMPGQSFPQYSYNSPRVNMSRQGTAPPSRGHQENQHNTLYNSRARKGFRYWPEDKHTGGGAPKQTIQGRLMKMGIGY